MLCCISGISASTEWPHSLPGRRFQYKLALCVVWSLEDFLTSSKDQSKKYQNTGPQLIIHSLPSLTTPLERTVSAFVCAPKIHSLPQCLIIAVFSEVVPWPGDTTAFCDCKTPSSHRLLGAPEAPGSCLDTSLKSFLASYHPESFCPVWVQLFHPIIYRLLRKLMKFMVSWAKSTSWACEWFPGSTAWTLFQFEHSCLLCDSSDSETTMPPLKFCCFISGAPFRDAYISLASISKVSNFVFWC